MTEFIFEDENGNQYSVNGTGISPIVSGSAGYFEDSFTWNSKIVPNTALPGNVKLGESRIEGRIMAFTADWVFETDVDFRTAFNEFMSAFNSVFYLIDNTNQLRLKVSPGKAEISHGSGSFKRSGTLSFDIDVLTPYWESLVETSVSAYLPANTFVEVAAEVLGSLKPSPKITFGSSSFTLSGATFATTQTSCAMSRLSDDELVMYGITSQQLRRYKFTAGVWALQGTSFALTQSGDVGCEGLNSLDAAVLSNTTALLGLYRYDTGTGLWALLGTTLAVSGVVQNGLARIDTNTLFVLTASGTARFISVYRHNGATWAQIGTSYPVLPINIDVRISAAGPNRVAVSIQGTEDTLSMYEWNETEDTLTLVGNVFPMAKAELSTNRVEIGYLDINRVIARDTVTSHAVILAFDEYNWRMIGTLNTVSTAGAADYTPIGLTPTLIATSSNVSNLAARAVAGGGVVSDIDIFVPGSNDAMTLADDTIFGTTVYMEEVVDNEEGTVICNALSRETLIAPSTGFVNLDLGVSYIRFFSSASISVNVAWRERYYV